MPPKRGGKARSAPRSPLPPALIEAVKNQRVILFIGAGASMEAQGPKGQKPPSSEDLRRSLASHFFGDDQPGTDLMTVADMVIEIAGQSVVYEKIRQMLDPLLPSQAHLLLPNFRWRAIATTNYDTLIEKAYAAAKNPLQHVVTFVKNTEPVEEKLQNTHQPLLLLKLHGCLTHLHDETIPLILPHEHYSRYEKNRNNLFNRLAAWTHESTFVFCGYSLGDAHIRNIIYRLEAEQIKRPTYYIVTPDMPPQLASYWSKKNIEVIMAKFGEFISQLNSAIPEMWRLLDAGVGMPEMPILRHFQTNADPSPSLKSALERDYTYIHASMATEPQTPRRFFEGYDSGWGAIVRDLDVKRRFVNDLLLEAVFEEKSKHPRFFLLRGPGGSGKTIGLKRAAWEAATTLDELVLWLEDDGALRADPIMELASLTGKRIFLVVDRAALQLEKIEALLKVADQKNIPLTVIGGERDNEWNMFKHRLATRWRPTEHRVGQLSRAETEELVTKLDKHDCLGLLAKLPREKQIEAFVERADRQLLVSLHEATRGKPFEDIVFDEYEAIPEKARTLYLDICTLNQFAVPV